MTETKKETKEMKDILGVPRPAAVLRSWRGPMGTGPLRWVLDHTAVEPPVWREYKSLREARQDVARRGYIVVSTEVSYRWTPQRSMRECVIRLVHRATAAAWERWQQAEAEREARWADAQPCFIRLGDLPPAGRSANHATGRAEIGISVFRGQWRPEAGVARILPRTPQEVGSLLGLVAHGLPAYIVDGRVVGTGSDGEPLLADVTIRARVRLE